MRRALVWLLACGAAFGPAHAEGGTVPPTCRPGATRTARVELYFGASGSRRAWVRFLAEVVTPRFPDGLTSLDGYGQWRGPHGLARDPTHVLIMLYSPDRTSDARIETIRRLYARRFRQASVLRVDTSVCASF